MNVDVAMARLIASKFHAGQKYGDEPYIYHLEAVADAVYDAGDERLRVVALLHDILEDTYCSPGLLYTLFPVAIVEAVEAITKRHSEPYEDYIAKVKANALALPVKIQDTLCNLNESVKSMDVRRIKKYSKQLQLLVE
jgi:(p)ppGpp synthase/HD superfamily hydrolase